MNDNEAQTTGLEDEVIGAVLLDKYRTERVIGRGGMGVVLEATHQQLEERVAIKLMSRELCENEEAVARFQREARVLFRIQNENVCRVLDVGTHDERPFMVMEFLQGEDLATTLARDGRVAVERALAIALQCCHGLAEVHARGIVHRDLKPENLFLTRGVDGSDCVKLLDFGLSKLQREPADNPAEPRARKLTAKAQVMGTPHYMSPEQWMSSANVGHATDQWALGAMLFEMLTGRPPFNGKEVGQICSAVLSQPVPDISKLCPEAPPGMQALLTKCLAKDPRSRYATVGQLALALAAQGARGGALLADRAVRLLEATESIESERSGSVSVLVREGPLSSDLAHTNRNPPQHFDFGGPDRDRPRTPTQQSWQKISVPPRRSRVALIAALAGVALVGIAVAIISSSEPEATTTPAAGSGAESPRDRGLAEAEAPIEAAAEPTASQAKQAAGRPPAPAKTAASPSKTKPTKPTSAQPPSGPAPPNPDSADADIFDGRY